MQFNRRSCVHKLIYSNSQVPETTRAVVLLKDNGPCCFAEQTALQKGNSIENNFAEPPLPNFYYHLPLRLNFIIDIGNFLTIEADCALLDHTSAV